MRKKRGGGGGANWMDTYGDMVTLLLCFFVMLYSMSSMDKSKWIALVQALNPSADISGTTTEVPPEGSEVTQEKVDADIEALYQAMQQYIQEENLTSQISITKGSGYVFVSFDDTVFFDGDSWELLDAGKAILDQVASSISEVSDSIDEIRVLGHTAQASDQPNRPEVDRFLASNRASVVTVYLQEKNIVDPSRLVSVGYGQWRPVADNSTSEGRAKNRRVELLVTGLDLSSSAGDDVTQYYTMRSGEAGSLEGTAAWTSGQEDQESTQTQTSPGQEG
ncbi:MAG: flagellar motor protein MotB [Oscillospiraceae bacterium]|nr:flagellar motor protein MotB [Oscillospiraceae bacterium]